MPPYQRSAPTRQQPWTDRPQRHALPVSRWLQEHPWSCGPATLKIVLDSIGLEVEESRLAQLAHTRPETGTQPAGLQRALLRLRVSHEIVEPASIEEIESFLVGDAYCVVDYQAWGRSGRDYRQLRCGHYSVVYGFDATHLLVADAAKKPGPQQPGWGRRRLRKDLFESRWHDRGPGGLRTRRWLMVIPRTQPRVVRRRGR